MCKTIVVEGLIGVGKSTFAEELKHALGPGTLLLREPDEKDEANPYLALFYANPARWALTMQVHLLEQRFGMHLLAQLHVLHGRGDAVVDRSYFGDTAFARLQVECGDMTSMEYRTYTELYHRMTMFVLHPNICLRLLVSPSTALERIEYRMRQRTGRECESGVSLEYLQRLDREIDHMIAVLRSRGVHIIDVPWDAVRETDEQRLATVRSVVERIRALKPSDKLLDMHRRTT